MMEFVKGSKPKGVDHADEAFIVELCEDDQWVAEQKFDGTRVIVTWDPDADKFGMMHHGGQPLKHTAATQWHSDLRQSMPTPEWGYEVDGELLCGDGTYVIYDVLQMQGGATREWNQTWQASFARRRHALEQFFNLLKWPATASVSVVIAKQARSHAEKAELVRRAHEEMFEGVVFKHVDAPYEPGKRVTSMLKLKFFREADLVISERDVDGCNARYYVFDDETGERVDMGGCSMIGKPDAQPGDVVEVRYLYVGAGGSLYTPSLQRIRDDKAPEECLTSQFRPVNRGLI